MKASPGQLEEAARLVLEELVIEAANIEEGKPIPADALDHAIFLLSTALGRPFQGLGACKHGHSWIPKNWKPATDDEMADWILHGKLP